MENFAMNKNIAANISAVLLATALLSCQSEAMAQGFEVSSPRRIPTPNEAPAKDTAGSPPSSESAPLTKNGETRDRCRDAFFQYALPLKKIARHIPNTKFAAEVMALDADDCLAPQRRIALVKLLTKLLNEHDLNALVLVPEDGKNTERNLATDALIRGMKSALGPGQEKSLNIVRIPMQESGQSMTVDDLIKNIAMTFWTTRPSMIISALTAAEDSAAGSLAKDLAIPVVIVGPAPIDKRGTKTKKSQRIFRIFPDEGHLAATLAKTACNRVIKKAAIIRPSSPAAENFANLFETKFKSCGGLVATGGVYVNANFESVDLAIKEIAPALSTAPGSSAGTAAKAGLLILDDARVARHAAKAAKLNGLPAITLMGHHRWRSATIIEPFDPAFEMSFFVDYLGLNLANTSSLPQFPDPQTTWQAVWLATGTRAGQLASATFQAGSGYPRKNLHRVMATLPAPQDRFFGSKTFFMPNLEAWWPAFVFTITHGSIQANPTIDQGEAIPAKP